MLKSIALWYLERDLSRVPREAITQIQSDGLLAQLWENPAFRKYIEGRNATLIYTLAGAPGAQTEPRDRFFEIRGQRMEILELGSKAKLCFERTIKNVKSNQHLDK